MDISKIVQQTIDAFAELEKDIPGDDLKTQKKLAIAKSVIRFANQLTSDLQKLHAYERKLPRIVRKTKYSKREAARLRIVSMIKAEVSRTQLYTIMSQPVPKFTKGHANGSGIAIV